MWGRQGEEGAGLVHGRAERGRGATAADQVEQVAVLPGGRVGPFARRARRLQADEERASRRAVDVARDPVAALLFAPGQIAAADFLGARGEHGGDPGRGRWCSGHGGPPLDNG